MPGVGDEYLLYGKTKSFMRMEVSNTFELFLSKIVNLLLIAADVDGMTG